MKQRLQDGVHVARGALVGDAQHSQGVHGQHASVRVHPVLPFLGGKQRPRLAGTVVKVERISPLVIPNGNVLDAPQLDVDD